MRLCFVARLEALLNTADESVRSRKILVNRLIAFIELLTDLKCGRIAETFLEAFFAFLTALTRQ